MPSHPSLSAYPAEPVLVEVTRGEVVESLHRGSAVVCDPSGRIIAGWGDVGRPVYPRSAVKPLQALPLIETGAADRFGLDDRHLALACASHGGEPDHVDLVLAWLDRVGLSPRDLECGAHPPSTAAAERMLAREGREPGPEHNNCSGKHAGFLTTAVHLGEPTAGYVLPDHPVQRRVAQALAEMTGYDITGAPRGTDGCSIPTFALPLAAIATGMARLARPDGLPAARVEAAARIRRAMAAHPHLVAGSGRLCTAVMTAAPEVLVKAGAEGVYAAILPRQGLGVAVKIADGAKRAAEVALLAVLERLGALTGEEQRRLASHFAPALTNHAGVVVGSVRPAAWTS